MKRRILLVGIFLFLTATISFAQVKILNKSTIVPEKAERSINQWSVGYAQNTKTGETLIIWFEWTLPTVCPDPDDCQPTDVQLVGQIRDAQGEAVGKPFTIAGDDQDQNNNFNCCFPDQVTYNPVKNEYLVDYMVGDAEVNNQGKILAVRLTADGKLKGKRVDITSRFSDRSSLSNRPFILKLDPATRGYLQFSTGHGFPAIGNTYGFFDFLSPKAKPTKPPVMLENSWPADFIFLHSGKILMATTSPVPTGGTNYLITTADPKNTNELKDPGEWTFVGTCSDPISRRILQEQPVLGFSSPGSILYFCGGGNVAGQTIDGNGKLIGDSFVAVNSPAKKKRTIASTVAFSETERGVVGVLITLEDKGFPNGLVTVWAQKVDAEGKPVGKSKKLLKTSATDRIETNQIFALPVEYGDTEARFVWYGLRGPDPKFSIERYELRVGLP